MKGRRNSLKILLRLVGLLLLAGGFIGFVIDGTRSIVNGLLSFGSLRDMIEALPFQSLPRLEQLAHHVHPALWDPILVDTLKLPASVTIFILGALLLWLGQKTVKLIGYAVGR